MNYREDINCFEYKIKQLQEGKENNDEIKSAWPVREKLDRKQVGEGTGKTRQKTDTLRHPWKLQL